MVGGSTADSFTDCSDFNYVRQDGKCVPAGPEEGPRAHA
jgi:hypothetical protein